MELNDIICSLGAINTNEKVDILIDSVKGSDIPLDRNTDLSIRNAIKKMKLQRYFIEKYSHLFKLSYPKITTKKSIKKAVKTKKKKKNKSRKSPPISRNSSPVYNINNYIYKRIRIISTPM